MKVKTSDLSYNALCYLVTKIQMPHLVWGKTIGLHHASNQIVVPELPEPNCYSPYMSWAMLGPIIEREKMAIMLCESVGDWLADLSGTDKVFTASGTTPLIAAAKCFVESKLGQEHKIPEELI